jgi:phosphatidylserine/phosphatidylglycerophosphate/cardiolipin synthase-like enzyme
MAANERIVLVPAERRAAVLDLIRSARRRLLLSLYRCDDRRVLEALGAARRRGVQVEVLLTRRGRDRSSLTLLRLLLESLGVSVCRYGSSVVKYHAKYVVADDARTLIGSLNFTRRCFKHTADFMLLSEDPDLAASLTILFEADRQASRTELPRDLSARLIVGPSQARQRIVGLLDGARSSIQLIDPKLNDPSILRLLAARSASGVNVHVLGARKIGGQRSHGKLLILDGRIAVVGSMALSASNLDLRREVAVTVQDPAAVRQLQRFFLDVAPRERPASPLCAETVQ